MADPIYERGNRHTPVCFMLQKPVLTADVVGGPISFYEGGNVLHIKTLLVLVKSESPL